jgi:hypothetical protein
MSTTQEAPVWSADYEKWKAEPTPENLSAAVKTLQPAIDYAMSGEDDPVLRMKARVLAAKAIANYDPARGASLPTWVAGNLRQLARYRREQRSPVKIGDRTQLEGWQLEQTARKFADEHGREADAGELADFSGLSVRKIKNLRQHATRIVPEGAYGESVPGADSDFTEEAMDYVFNDADHVDRMIMQHKTGYGGSPLLSNQELSTKLQLHPSQITRRAQKLSYRVGEIEDTLRSTT